jgi:hypothetical protein
MTPEELRDRVLELIEGRPVKLWLVKQVGHRLDFLWSAGSAQLEPEQTLAEGRRYYLIGQKVPEDLKPQLLQVFDDFLNGDYVRNEPDDDRRLRLITLE